MKTGIVLVLGLARPIVVAPSAVALATVARAAPQTSPAQTSPAQTSLVRRESARRTADRARLYGFRNVVSGRVTDARGRPVAGIPVGTRFWMPQSGAPGEGDAFTGPDGRYEIRALGVNDFSVGVGVQGTPYLAPAPKRANLTKATRLVRDFTLQEGPLVTVRVRDAESGTPVEGIAVRGDRFGTGGPVLGRTGRDGSFSWRSNSLEFTISLGDSNDVAARNAVGAAPGYRFERPVKLATSAPFLWETKAYRRPYDPKEATFRGVVVDEKGTPVVGARVAMLQSNARATGVTGAGGRFSLKGRRILNFGGDHRDDIVLFVDEGARSATVRPRTEETWREMRIVARPNGKARASGRAVDERGRPAAGVPVSVGEYFGGDSGGGWSAGATDANGRFTIDRLRPGGRYTVSLGGGDWGALQIPADWRKGASLTFVAGERRDLGKAVVPRAGSVVAGVVVAPGGGPVKGPYGLRLRGAHVDLPVEVDPAGRFRIPRVVAEPLVLSVYATDSQGITRIGEDSPDLLLRQKVRAGDRRVRLVVRWRPARP